MLLKITITGYVNSASMIFMKNLDGKPIMSYDRRHKMDTKDALLLPLGSNVKKIGVSEQLLPI